MDAIKLADKEQAARIVLEIYKSILQANGTAKYVSSLLWQSMNGIVRGVSSMGMVYDDVMGQSFFDDFVEYNKLEDIDAMLTFIQKKIVRVIDHINDKETLITSISWKNKKLYQRTLR